MAKNKLRVEASAGIIALLLFSGCAANPPCRISAKEGGAFEEMVLPPHHREPAEYRVRGIYQSGFERSEIDLGSPDAPIIYCVLFERQCSRYMERKFGSDLTERKMTLSAIVAYSEEAGLNCPFGTVTVQRILEVSAVKEP